MSAQHPASEINLGAPVGAGYPTEAPTANNNSINTPVPYPASTGEAGGNNINTIDNVRSSSGDHSSNDGTLNDNAEGSGGTLGVPAQGGDESGLQRSSNSSFVGELGGPGHVSVRRGKEEFAALERRFSNLSQNSDNLQRYSSRRSVRSGFLKAEKIRSVSSGPDPSDAEKGRAAAEEEEFNLAEVLRSGREKKDEAGIKRKQVGVVWEDLEVIGAGGMRINIRNFSSAVIEQFMVSAVTETVKARARRLTSDAGDQGARRGRCRPVQAQAQNDSVSHFGQLEAGGDVPRARSTGIGMLDLLEEHHEPAGLVHGRQR